MLGSPQPHTSLSVSELTRDAKNLLESHFDQVRVEGEIGDFTAASSGHWYFTLKDADSQVRCAMFRGANSRINVRPSKGDSVVIRARVTLYEQRGEFQLVVQHLALAGDGALQLAFEQLKNKLQAEGLFDASRKATLPSAARRVGVITSATGAALHDILSVLGRRSPMTEVVLFPVPVQGIEAPAALCRAIKQANSLHATEKLTLDVLIIGRGGGSLEDLWAFNDEQVARHIAASDIPTVSAVGHEVDFSIADFTADQRAATPSAAAELVSIDQSEWMHRFDTIGRRLTQTMLQRIRQRREGLEHIYARLRNPASSLQHQRNRVSESQRRLTAAVERRLQQHHQQLNTLNSRLRRCHPVDTVKQRRQQLDMQRGALTHAMSQRLARTRQSVAQDARLLQSLGPTNTLSRGYAIVQTESGDVVRDATQLALSERLNVRIHRGEVGVRIEDITPEEE